MNSLKFRLFPCFSSQFCCGFSTDGAVNHSHCSSCSSFFSFPNLKCWTKNCTFSVEKVNFLNVSTENYSFFSVLGIFILPIGAHSLKIDKLGCLWSFGLQFFVFGWVSNVYNRFSRKDEFRNYLMKKCILIEHALKTSGSPLAQIVVK